MMINWPAVGATLLPNVGGWLGGIITAQQVRSKDGEVAWYDTIVKPDWRPPNWAFGPVWTTLYCGMGYASYLVYRDGGGFSGPAKVPLILYGTQLALNWCWTPIFFGAHDFTLSLVTIGLLSTNVALCGAAFYRINKYAGYVFVPYMAWMMLASTLNYVIWRDNPRKPSAKITELKK